MRNLVCHNPEFNESLQAFKLRIKQEGRSQSSQSGFTNHLQDFLNHLKHFQIETTKQINQEVLDMYWDYLLNHRTNEKTGLALSGTYINKIREAVLRYMEFLTQTKVGESIYKIPYLKTESKTVQVLTKDEIQQLFNSCDNTLSGITDKCILSLLYGCGIRRGELVSLEVNEIDFSKGLIRLDKTKTRHQRDVVMSPSVQRNIEEYMYSARNMMLGKSSDETYLIVTEKGYRIANGTIPWRLNKMCERAGLNKKIGPHLLRHSIATHLMSDLTLEEIAEFLGQKCLDSTQIYTHFNKEIE